MQKVLKHERGKFNELFQIQFEAHNESLFPYSLKSTIHTDEKKLNFVNSSLFDLWMLYCISVEQTDFYVQLQFESYTIKTFH